MDRPLIDRLIIRADETLRAIAVRPAGFRSWQDEKHARSKTIPAKASAEKLSAQQKKHSAGLMRVNHTGEVCAQALYKGQALFVRSNANHSALLQSAAEENDHLFWCAERLQELQAAPSLLDPVWLSLSFGLGVAVGAAGDAISLGFVAATEEQVCRHLRDHLERLPSEDVRSRIILETMLTEEAIHGEKALAQGGIEFSPFTKKLMGKIAEVMTRSSYYI